MESKTTIMLTMRSSVEEEIIIQIIQRIEDKNTDQLQALFDINKNYLEYEDKYITLYVG